MSLFNVIVGSLESGHLALALRTMRGCSLSACVSDQSLQGRIVGKEQCLEDASEEIAKHLFVT